MKMGMMGGAFKRGGKDEEKGPKEDKKKDKKDKDKGAPPPKGVENHPANTKSTSKPDSLRIRKTNPDIHVVSPDQSHIRPAIITQQRRVLPKGISRMASLTDQVINHKENKVLMNPNIPRGSRRASMPASAFNGNPFLSPNDMRGALAKNPSLRRKSTQLPHRRRSFNIVDEDEFCRDPLECLLPNYEHEEKLNVPPVSFSIKCSMYLDCIGIGLVVGILLALIVKGIFVFLDFII